MATVPKRERRRPRPFSLEQGELRIALMQRYRESRHYQNRVVKDVRPYWRALSGEPAHLFEWWKEAPGTHDCPAPVHEYVRAVETLVTRLSLVSGGQPAPWAAEFVHADATAGPFGTVVCYSSALSLFTLKIDASAGGATLRQVRETQVDSQGQTAMLVEAFHSLTGKMERDADDLTRYVTQRENVVAQRHVEPAVEGGFDEWEAVREAARALIDAWIAETRNKWRLPGSSFRYQNPSTVTRQRALLDQLYQHIAEAIPIDHSSRPSVKRLAETLGLDFPRATRAPR